MSCRFDLVVVVDRFDFLLTHFFSFLSCATNQSIATKWDVPLVGCASHRFALAVKEWISQQRGLAEAIKDLSTLMSKAANCKTAARLRELTMDVHGKCLAPKQHSDGKPRWTSIMTMIERYFRIKDEMEQCDALTNFLLSARANRTLQDAREPFRLFHGITNEIQQHATDLWYVRQQFDAVLENPDYVCMKKYLAVDADIIHSENFEKGIVKIMEGARLNDQEVEACRKLQRKEVHHHEGEPADGVELTTEEKLALNRKRRKLSGNYMKGSHGHKYVNPGLVVCATSNCCERLFSEAKYVMIPQRRAMSPILFEALLFLKKNAAYWNISTVATAMKSNGEGRVGAMQARDQDFFYED